MKFPIFLMGMMGSGKTTWGKLLATRLKVEFADLDDLIEEGEGKSIAEIFRDRGEAEFRKIESAYLKRIDLQTSKVVGLGGGTPCYNNNITWLNEHGLTIFLDVSPGYLLNNLIDQATQRPLIAAKSKEELKVFLEEMLSVRKKFYEQAKIIIKKDITTVESLVDELNSYSK